MGKLLSSSSTPPRELRRMTRKARHPDASLLPPSGLSSLVARQRILAMVDERSVFAGSLHAHISHKSSIALAVALTNRSSQRDNDEKVLAVATADKKSESLSLSLSLVRRGPSTRAAGRTARTARRQQPDRIVPRPRRQCPRVGCLSAADAVGNPARGPPPRRPTGWLTPTTASFGDIHSTGFPIAWRRRASSQTSVGRVRDARTAFAPGERPKSSTVTLITYWSFSTEYFSFSYLREIPFVGIFFMY